MIDPVALDRMELALATGRPPRFSVPIPPDERWAYYRELVYMGYTSTSIANTLGWNSGRIQADLRNRRHRRPDNNPEPAYVHTSDVHVDCRPGALMLTIAGHTTIIEGSDYDLMALGRIIYSAATNHQEQSA